LIQFISRFMIILFLSKIENDNFVLKDEQFVSI
jgi:hypothetical protein